MALITKRAHMDLAGTIVSNYSELEGSVRAPSVQPAKISNVFGFQLFRTRRFGKVFLWMSPMVMAALESFQLFRTRRFGKGRSISEPDESSSTSVSNYSELEGSVRLNELTGKAQYVDMGVSNYSELEGSVRLSSRMQTVTQLLRVSNYFRTRRFGKGF